MPNRPSHPNRPPQPARLPRIPGLIAASRVLAAAACIAPTPIAHAQHLDQSELVDWVLAADDTTEPTRETLDREWSLLHRWPRAAAEGSGWALLDALIPATQRFDEASQALRDQSLNADDWAEDWPVPNDTAERIARIAQQAGLIDLYQMLPTTHNFLPPTDDADPDNNPATAEAIAQVGRAMLQIQQHRLGSAIRDDQWWTAAAIIEEMHAWPRLLAESTPGNLSILSYTPRPFPNRPEIFDATAMFTHTAARTINTSLDIGLINDPEATVLLYALHRGRTALHEAISRHHTRTINALRAELTRLRHALGIDTHDEPGMATSPRPVNAANQLLDAFQTPPAVQLRAIPTGDELDELEALITWTAGPSLHDTLALANIAQQPLDSPAAGLPWLSYALRDSTKWTGFRAYSDSLTATAAIRLALRAHEHRHGSFPVTLADLDADLRNRIPTDPLAPDAQYRYRLVDDNHAPTLFLIYSTGLDGQDDNAPVHPDEPQYTQQSNDALAHVQDILTSPGDPLDALPDPGFDRVLFAPPLEQFLALDADPLFTPAFLRRLRDQAREPR